MSSSTRIPRNIDGFNSYIVITADYLATGTPTNASRLGIADTELAAWTAIGTEWTPLYAKYSDKKNSRTTAIKDQLLSIIDEAVAFDQTNHLLDRIASSTNATIADLETFNIKGGVLKKTTRSISTTSITELVTVTLQPIGGGLISVKCYTTTGQRAGIYEDADCVQFLYSVGTTPPASVEADGLKSGLSSKGIFTVDTGASSTGKYLYIYFRWYNTHYPALAGPWSILQTTLIV